MEQLGGSGIAWQIRFKVFIESKHERKIWCYLEYLWCSIEDSINSYFLLKNILIYFIFLFSLSELWYLYQNSIPRTEVISLTLSNKWLLLFNAKCRISSKFWSYIASLLDFAALRTHFVVSFFISTINLIFFHHQELWLINNFFLSLEMSMYLLLSTVEPTQ